jgi:HEAT repeat protein
MRLTVAALAALLLACPSGAQERKPAEDALFALRASFSEGDEQDQVDAIRKGAELPDLAVIEELARGLHAPSPCVREAAILALGRNRSPKALAALHALWGSGWRLRENEELFVRLVRSIGRRGDPSSLPLLADRPAFAQTLAVGTARVAAMARIRTRDSLLALLEGQRQAANATRPRRRGAGPILAVPYQSALAELTGVDRGAAAADWQSWWKQSGGGFAVPEKRPEIGREHRLRWEAYWGEPWTAGRPVPAPLPPGLPTVRVENPTPEEAAAALAGLKASLLEEDGDAAAAGIEEFAPVDAPAVTSLLAAGVGWPRPAIRNACVRGLGWLGTPDALEALHRFHRTSTALFKKDEDLHVLVLKSIARHGSVSSIPELGDTAYREETFAAGAARILGLARIRHRDSVEAIFDALSTGGARTRLALHPAEPRFIEPARLALMILTCQDFGNDAAAWQRWWSENEKGFQVPRVAPDLPPELRRDWEEFWGVAYK